MKRSRVDRLCLREHRRAKKDGDELDERLGLVVQDSLTGSCLLSQALFSASLERFTCLSAPRTFSTAASAMDDSCQSFSYFPNW